MCQENRIETKFLEMKTTMSEMISTVDVNNSRSDTAEGRISGLEDRALATI